MTGPNTGVPLKEAMRRTGYSYGQMRGLRNAGQCRWQRRGKNVFIHPEDVEAMEKAAWVGKPFDAKEVSRA